MFQALIWNNRIGIQYIFFLNSSSENFNSVLSIIFFYLLTLVRITVCLLNSCNFRAETILRLPVYSDCFFRTRFSVFFMVSLNEYLTYLPANTLLKPFDRYVQTLFRNACLKKYFIYRISLHVYSIGVLNTFWEYFLFFFLQR